VINPKFCICWDDDIVPAATRFVRPLPSPTNVPYNAGDLTVFALILSPLN